MTYLLLNTSPPFFCIDTLHVLAKLTTIVTWIRITWCLHNNLSQSATLYSKGRSKMKKKPHHDWGISAVCRTVIRTAKESSLTWCQGGRAIAAGQKGVVGTPQYSSSVPWAAQSMPCSLGSRVSRASLVLMGSINDALGREVEQGRAILARGP